MDKWKLVKSVNLITTKYIRFLKNKYEFKGKIIDDYFIVEKDSFVLVVAMFEGKVVLGRQYRPATDSFYWSVPAGYIEKGENPIVSAKRELLEETGIVGKKFHLVGQYDLLPGYIKSRAFVITCQFDKLPHKFVENDEFQEIKAVPWKEILKSINNGKINEAQTALALLLVKENLEIRT